MSTERGYGRGRGTPVPGPSTPRAPPEVEEPDDDEMETPAPAAQTDEESSEMLARMMIEALTRLANEQAASQRNIQELTAAIGPHTRLRTLSPHRAGTTKTTKVVKVGTPDTYSGGKDKLKPFLAQTELYTNFNRDLFVTEADKVLYTASYLRGAAANWFQPYQANYLSNDATTPETREIL